MTHYVSGGMSDPSHARSHSLTEYYSTNLYSMASFTLEFHDKFYHR